MVEMYLHLSDGTTFSGQAFGDTSQECSGEIVFSTGMTGYCQSLTDPSFAGQVLVFTYPIIGNYGVPKFNTIDTHLMENLESEQIWVNGVVISSLSSVASHYQSVSSFSDWLEREHIPGIVGVDTRALTLKLREHGVMNGVISKHAKLPQQFQAVPKDVVKTVSIKERIIYKPLKNNGKHIAIVDCGVKHGIIRGFLNKGYKITRLPYNDDPLTIKDLDGVVVSNGPGDPKDCSETITTIRNVLKEDIPYLGICLGNQLLSLAVGGDTFKLPYGHRGLNQPCQDSRSHKVYITSQNHGYAVEPSSLPEGYEEWFTNINDGTNEGIIHKIKPIRSVQFHPEGCPGPKDTAFIFGIF